jgi:hypothetical protein
LPKQLKSAVHHYWPTCLSEFWADSEGQVNRLSWDGTRQRSQPKNFGGIGNGHRITFGGDEADSIWDDTIEPMFDASDSNFPHLVTHLLGLESKTGVDQQPIQARLLGQNLDDQVRTKLAESIASLIVRSPAFRNKIKITVDSLRQGIPYMDSADAQNLILVNMRQEFEGIVKLLSSGGKLVVMYSDTSEFLFGEGFLHNLHGMNRIGPKFFVPLTPIMSLAFVRPSSYMSLPNCLTIRLRQDEVDMCNEVCQIYTGRYLYCRGDFPRVSEDFTSGQFLEFKYHRYEWLDDLLGNAADYREPRSRA